MDVPLTALLMVTGAAGPSSYLPPEELNLVLDAPITTWDEAVPLGNGLLGGLLWGEGSLIRLSLDRGDLWDLRPAEAFLADDWTFATMKRQIETGDFDGLHRMYDDPYNVAHPSKVPAGRLEIDLDPSQEARRFVLDLATAQGRVELSDGQALTCFYGATDPVALLRVTGPPPRGFRLLGPTSVAVLGFPPATFGEEGTAKWYVQEGVDGLRYVCMAAARRDGDNTLIAVTVASSRGEIAPLTRARSTVERALAEGYDPIQQRHREWWLDFWSRSRVNVPDWHILQHYYLVQYFYGAASRLGSPPIPLQGVWTADAGGLPPWKGDYHNDLNTQTTYIGYLTSGRFESGESFLQFLWELLPSFREFARDFYDAPGAMVPGVMGLDGQPLGGWAQYTLTPGNAGWLVWMFADHWRYTGNEAFLRERAYPWCREIGECVEALLEPDAAGRLRLPLSSSPEIHDNSPRAWLRPNSNYDQACLIAMFASLTEMARALGENGEAARWSRLRQGLGDLLLEESTGELMYAQDEPVRYSHRHLSHSMAIHPFNLINIDGDAADRRTIRATSERYDQLGTSAWCGYSLSWMACLRARVGDAEAAYRNLDAFVRAFILRNGFHVNGDQSGLGLSSFTYRPFTLEGNFLATQAVHEMLLQSWSPRPGMGDAPVVRLFPAMPWRWHDAEFADLRAEGGYRVSARREKNATTWFRIVAGSDGLLHIRDSFGGRVPDWSRDGVRRAGDVYEVHLRAGDAIEANLPVPDSVPPAPADAALPLPGGE